MSYFNVVNERSGFRNAETFETLAEAQTFFIAEAADIGGPVYLIEYDDWGNLVALHEAHQ